MKLELAEILVEIFDEFGVEAEVIDYSGRGMGGKRTYGVVFDDDEVLFAVFYRLGREYSGYLNDVEELRMDRVGKKFVLY